MLLRNVIKKIKRCNVYVCTAYTSTLSKSNRADFGMQSSQDSILINQSFSAGGLYGKYKY